MTAGLWQFKLSPPSGYLYRLRQYGYLARMTPEGAYEAEPFAVVLAERMEPPLDLTDLWKVLFLLSEMDEESRRTACGVLASTSLLSEPLPLKLEDLDRILSP